MINPAENPKVRVKICGITTVDDGIAVAALGADAIGLNFYQPSPRYIDVTTAAAIAAAVGPFVTVAGLFVNASAEKITEVLQQVPLNLLQFHGDETAEFCEQFERPYIKAIRVSDNTDVVQAINQYVSASGVLLDTYRAGVPGGTGEVFNWQLVPSSSAKPIILAGGLTPANVADAVAQTQPYAVDVSGGVETDSVKKTGKKDFQKVAAFIQAATGV